MSEKPKTLRFLKYQISRIERKTENLNNFNLYSLKHYMQELESCFTEFCNFYSGGDFDEAMEKEYEDYVNKYESARSRLMNSITELGDENDIGISHARGTHDVSLLEILEKQTQLIEALSRGKAGDSKIDGNKLPHLKIPVFRGNLREWVKFKNLFLSIVDGNTSLSDTEKLNHLLSVVDGEPLTMIKHFPIVGRNYAHAWSTLVSEYDNNYVLIRDLIGELSNSPHIDGKPNNLRNLWTLLSETVQALNNMGEYGSSRDPWIIYAVVSKFDKRTAEKWSELVVDNDEPDVETLISFLSNLSSSQRLMGTGFTQKPSEVKSTIKKMAATVVNCFLCGGQHSIFKCHDFLNMAIKDRDALVKQQKRCINCFGLNHFSNKCSNRSSCFHCRKRHHTLLHYLDSPSANPSVRIPVQNNDVKTDDQLIKINVSLGAKATSAILPTATVEILDGTGSYVSCRVLLDSGAQASFITEKFFRKLMIRRSQTRVPVQFMSGTNSFHSKGAVSSVFRSRFKPENRSSVVLHILPRLMERVPERKLEFNSVSYLKENFELADGTFDIPGDVDVIIGADHFFGIIGPGKYFHKTDKIWVMESLLGWLVSGGAEDLSQHTVSVNAICETDKLDTVLERFWHLDEQSADHLVENEDSVCEELFKTTTKREPSGQYSVSLPFKDPRVVLGDSYRAALFRFYSLERKFRAQPNLREKYCSLMKVFENDGYIEKVPDTELELPISERFYLPHYGVFKRDEPNGKMRIVFDASTKSDNGVSLNDCVLTGPKFQTEIFSIICSFRMYKFVFSADIVKMYRKIQINRHHTDFQRILWRTSEDDPIEHWRLKTLMDGVNAAPYLALRTMEELASDESSRFPKGSVALASRYMDDFFIGSDDMADLISVRDELIGILNSATMHLDKWASNDPRILEGIPDSNKLSNESLVIKSKDVVKTLGVHWNFVEDYFTFSMQPSNIKTYSRRSLVSETAKIFDPCGWISPVTVILKALFQKTWLERLGWDDQLPTSIKGDWLKIESSMHLLNKIKIRRCFEVAEEVEVHGFCDSSMIAYSAVVYLRTFSTSGNFESKLIASRTKLCPLKQVSMPRLELCGAQLLARLMKSVFKIFEHRKVKYYCWSDSKTVIAWLSSHPSRWKTFVGNRCATIHELIPHIPWRYVKSELNPADLGSRGMPPEKLVSSDLWWFGPSWLRENWHQYYEAREFDTDEEVRPLQIYQTTRERPFYVLFVERYSCFDRFRRAFAYFLRFVDNLMRRVNNFEPLSAEEIWRAILVFLRLYQNFTFGCGSEIPASISNLTPFRDGVGLLRVGGRLANLSVDYDSKHPLIIPIGHFSNILIDWVHKRYYHSGLRLTMTLIKQRFFIRKLRNSVKKVISNCSACTKFKAKAYTPEMANLPEFRLQLDKPFEMSGIDFAGPIMMRPYVGRGRMTLKGYICVIICLATKAINLELVTDLSSEALILALRRFISRHGHCRVMLSDNGRNFLGCSRILSELKNKIAHSVESPEVKKFLLENIIDWRFIPPYSPHFGGIWEASVKSVKYHLGRTFEGKILTIDELHTALLEISSILNSRPISALSEDVDDLEVLTPSHFLTGRPSVCIPVIGDMLKSSESSRRVDVSSLVCYFWKRWKNEFLQNYLKKVKWRKSGLLPAIGDLVLIKRPNSYPSQWSRGRVLKLIPGRDGIVRTVEVKTANDIRLESARNLIPMLLKHEASMGEYGKTTLD